MAIDLLTILYVAGAIGSITGLLVTLVLYLLRRGPHLDFYTQVATLTVDIDGKKQKVKMVLGRIENNRSFLGESAHKLECNLALTAKVHETDRESATFHGPLPWIKMGYADEVLNVGPINGDLDLIKLFERFMWDREKVDIPQGHHELVAIAAFFEATKKMYWAKNPLELIGSPSKGAAAFMTPFALELSGDNYASTYSPSSFMMVFEDQFTMPESSELTHTPSRFLNFLLRIGLWSHKETFLPNFPGVHSVIQMRTLKLSTGKSDR